MNPTSLPWSAYRCEEYFADAWNTCGCFDEMSGAWIVLRERDVRENLDAGFLVTGHSGFHGIEPGFRRGKDGIWAFNTQDGTFQFLVYTIAELVVGYPHGTITIDR